MYGTLISSVTVGAGGAASIDFTSIPQTYTDLVVIISHRNDGGANQDNISFRLNGSSAGTYSARKLEGNGSGASAGSTSNITSDQYPYSNSQSSSANTFTNTQYYFPNYSVTGTKTWSIDTVFENNATTGYQQIIAGSYGTSVSGITSLSFYSGYTTSQYSTAYLYGLLKGSGGATAS